MTDIKHRVDQLINDIKCADYCCKQIIAINQDLEELRHQMSGMGHSGPSLTKEQEKSSLPMPSFHGHNVSLVDLMYREDRMINEREYYEHRIRECKPIELLSLLDQNMIFDLYFKKVRPWDVAEKYGYTRTSLYKHIRFEMSKLM